MKRFHRSIAFAAAAGFIAFSSSSSSSAAAAWMPAKQVECIAPANPGGGWDTICRTTSNVLQKAGLLKSTMYVTNMPGGSGAVAIANVVAKRKSDPNVVVAASNSLTFTIAMGRTPHSYEDVIPLAQLGAEYGGFFVKADSRLKTLSDLVTALKADAKAVTFAGGSALGSLDHVKVALLARAIAVDPTKVVYVPFQGGGEALTSLLGGHTEVASMDISEAAAQIEAGKLRCLALLADRRSTKFKDIPTTFEQGVQVSFPIWRGLYLPPGVPEEAVRFWSDTIQKMTASPEWSAELVKLGWEPAYKSGAEFRAAVKEEHLRYKAMLKELGFVK